jgi:SAM-dependent methyltransferase
MRRCPACDADVPIRTRYGRGEWWIARCGACGFAYLADAPPYEAVQSEFEWTRSHQAERRRRNAQPLRSRVRRLIALRKRLLFRRDPMEVIRRRVAGGTLLDIGCGGGGRLAQYGDRYRLIGIELSPVLAAKAAAAFAPHGGRVLATSGKEGLMQLGTDSVDAAVLRSYLEHELHPRDVLAELLRVLRPGGIAVVKVPNFASVNRLVMGREWCGFRFPDHVNYFTPRSLAAVARAAGFELRLGLFDRLPFSDSLWAVLMKPASPP